MHIYDLDTPALVADLDVLERNIQGMALLCAEIGIALRVHTKTHKVPEIAKMQVAAGSQGITCQKLGEAEVMAQAGIDDILIPYNIVGKPKLRRLSTLAQMTTMTIAVDSEATAKGISAQAAEDGCDVRIIVELDTGSKRCGVQSPQAALELGKLIVGMPGLSLRGVMTYPSRLKAKPFLQETIALFREAGLPCDMISGGGTSSEAASRMITTVVSVPTDDRIIIDGGQKTFGSYPPKPYGLIIEAPEAKIYGMSVEHGHVDVSQCKRRFCVGDKLSVIPLHQGMVSNMHNELAAARNDQVELIWAIKGRGKVR
jgi:D-serine deaminase-like pyridoxal phosphate-dependent protein